MKFSERKCAFCGKLFIPNSSNQRYCKGPHYMNCPVCGKRYVVKNNENLKRPPVACSYACRTELRKQTSLKRYGITAPGNNPEARKKAEQTMLEKYGAPTTLQSKELKSRVIETVKLKYGVNNIMKNQQIMEKSKETQRKNHGGKLAFNTKESYQHRKATVYSRYGSEIWSNSEMIAKANVTKFQRYGKQRGHYGIVSHYNQQVGQRLENLGYTISYEYPIETYRYDIRIENTNILIEVNPSYTHSLVATHWGTHIDKLYHFKKTQVAENHGFHCIHIFDWDNLTKVLDILSPKIKIGARSCSIHVIDTKMANEFLNQNHLQGSVRGQILCIGLYYLNELVEVMTFGYPRYTKKYDWELLRLCSRADLNIIGGASKLFKYAVNNYQLNNIISYCNYSKFYGDVYYRLGMSLLKTTVPNIVWSKDSKFISSNLLQARGYDQLFHTHYGKGTSNEELMLNSGWLPVPDCGQLVFEYKI